MKIFTNWGITTGNIGNNFGEIIILIKNCEIQNNIITRNTFEKIFFINKIINNINKAIFPEFFYNFDFHNINIFLSHFIFSNNNIHNQLHLEIEESQEEENNEINLDSKEKDKDNILFRELIHSNEILSILILICFKVISQEEIESIKIEVKDKLINNKYINKKDFINIKFPFEEKISNECKNYEELSSKCKLFLYEINENKNGLLHFIHFTDLISLKSLKFESILNKKQIKNYFDLFYH